MHLHGGRAVHGLHDDREQVREVQVGRGAQRVHALLEQTHCVEQRSDVATAGATSTRARGGLGVDAVCKRPTITAVHAGAACVGS